MTKTEARRLARQARKHGHYASQGGFALYVFCPVCHQRVDAPYEIGKSKSARLDGAMLFHLDGYCGETT